MSDTVKNAVREAYRSAALEILAGEGSCCDPGRDTAECFGTAMYEALDTEGIPDAATAASLGCGDPSAIAGLRPGDTVLDLGSGGGLDVLLSARAVGPDGRVIGLDMTEEMVELARRNLRRSGMSNVEFVRGEIESIPLPDHCVDVVISNCVINLSPDKPAVLREAHRVLVPGGRLAITDVVATRRLTDAERADMGAWTGCIAGALTIEEFAAGLASAGFHDIEIEPTHRVAPDALSARISAIA